LGCISYWENFTPKGIDRVQKKANLVWNTKIHEIFRKNNMDAYPSRQITGLKLAGLRN